MVDIAGDKMSLWRVRPDIFVREVFGAIPDAWQDEALRAFPHNKRIAMRASKGPGKTTVLAWICWNFLLTRPNCKVAATSISAENLSDGLWAEMAKWQNKSKLLTELFEWTKTRIECKQYSNTWFMSARAWSKSATPEQQGLALAGFHEDYILFVLDEAGGIPQSVMVNADAALSSCKEGHIVQAGNTTQLDGPLYRACTIERSLWHIIDINGDPDNPNRSPRVSMQWAQDLIKMYGRDHPYVKVNVLGEFPPASFNALIGVDEVNDAMQRSYTEMDYGDSPRILGVDVARDGSDASVIFPRQGLQAFTPLVYRNIDGTQGASITARKWRDWSADACFVDNTGGFGSSWVDNLVRLGFAPIPVHFAQKSDNPRYFNKRSEMIFECVEWIKRGGALPNVPELIAELTQSTYTFKNDKLMIEPKELMKAKIGRSPDHMDSLCLVENTMILTPHGEIPIQDIIVGDVVCTPFGDTRVVRTWISHTDKLTTVRFSNGSILSGKGEHKIFTWGVGQCALGALSMVSDRVSTVHDIFLWRVIRWFIGGRNIQFKSMVDIIRAERTVTALGFFTVMFGWIISEKYQKLTQFIIKTMIGIQESQKNNGKKLFQRSNGVSFARKITKHIWGTRSTVLQHVHSVSDIEDILQTKENALGAAIEKKEKKNDLYIQRKFALLVGIISSLLGITGIRKIVPVHVRQSIVGETKVYNLTLEKHNAYYANDILVYNCLTWAAPAHKAPQTINGWPINQINGNFGAKHTYDYNPYSRDMIRNIKR